MSQSKNPYLVLGLEYGATETEARRAFAKAARRAKRDERFPYTHEDLTAALHEVGEIGDGHRSDLRFFRVPAKGSDDALESGVLNPGPELISRRMPPTDADIEALRLAAADDVAGVLLIALRANLPIDPWDN